jgi:N-carbamoyl-D-amino-acid hydrolase
MIAGSIIVRPDGEIVAEAKSEDDELIDHDCDLDAPCSARRRSSLRAPPPHRAYGRITSQTGVIPPPQG